MTPIPYDEKLRRSKLPGPEYWVREIDKKYFVIKHGKRL